MDQETPTPGLPPLYRALSLLDRERHRALRLRADAGYRFSAGQTLVPLTLAEFEDAACVAPVVFLRAGGALSVAMATGLEAGRNDLLDGAGRWPAGAYVPAYLRRYPFILVDGESGQRIGMDPEAWHFSRIEGEALFEDGQEGAAIARIRALCLAYSAAWEATQPFLEALDGAGVLVPGQTVITRKDGSRHRVDGFEIVDPERLAALPDATLAAWLRQGYLAAVHAHRASLKRWPALV